MEATYKKIPYYKAEIIMDTEYPMFDIKTNKMFGTKAAYIKLENWEPIAITAENMQAWRTRFFDYILDEEQLRRANKILK